MTRTKPAARRMRKLKPFFRISCCSFLRIAIYSRAGILIETARRAVSIREYDPTACSFIPDVILQLDFQTQLNLTRGAIKIVADSGIRDASGVGPS